MRKATADTIQKALVRMASRDVQLTSSPGGDADPRVPRVDAAPPDCAAAAVARAPSGSIPMSSGRRRMMTIMGKATTRLKYPIRRKAIRQSATSVITENAWTISAPLMGR